MKYKLRDTAGSAFIELAIVLPILTVLVIASAEMGRIAYAAIEVSNAARAGVAYGAQTDFTARDSAGIKLAAQDEAPDVTSLTATPVNACVCESVTTATGGIARTPISVCSGDSSTIATDCPTSTSATVVNYVVNYVSVSTSATVSTMFHYPGIPSSYSLSGYAKMRLEQD
jgi:Flp pilus assembly protein TadG